MMVPLRTTLAAASSVPGQVRLTTASRYSGYGSLSGR
jgi:hypothetical protein